MAFLIPSSYLTAFDNSEAGVESPVLLFSRESTCSGNERPHDARVRAQGVTKGKLDRRLGARSGHG
jgi:hypothetical protein